MLKPIVSISGIRGIIGKSLFPENIIKYVSAFAKYIGHKRVVIGRDGRLFGGEIEKIIEAALIFNGCEVINLGIAPTPTITLAVETLKAQGGISITASHNPQEWNGMKFINSKGIFLNAEENKKFLKFLDEESDKIFTWNKLKQVEYYPSFFDYHINKVLNIKSLNLRKIKQRKFKVVLDCVNSSGSVILPMLLKKLGCSVIKIDCDSSGIFTRKPEPILENIKNTCSAVKKNKADLGIVVDPDADRLVLINEKGEPYVEEYTIVTCINHVLKNVPQNKRIAVANLSTTYAVDTVVKELGGKLYKSPVGEINVIEKMKKVKAVIGGEGSGGVILPEVHYGRDSLVGIALVLSEFAEFGGKVSEYKKRLPEYYIAKTKLPLPVREDSFGEGGAGDSIITALKEKYFSFPQNEEDGLRIDFPENRGWVNFRKSNTEPILRIITEAKSKKEAEELQKEIIKQISL